MAIAVADVAQTLAMALGGGAAGTRAHRDGAHCRWRSSCACRARRAFEPAELCWRCGCAAADGGLVPLGEIGTAQRRPWKSSRSTARTCGGSAWSRPTRPGAARSTPSWTCKRAGTADPLPAGYSVDWAGEGEWNITVDVFRDLGLAFGVALLLICVLLVAQTGSLLMPVHHHGGHSADDDRHHAGVLAAEPAHRPPGGRLCRRRRSSPPPAMIGMIALAGIVVRNSIILIDFIHLSQAARPEPARGDPRSRRGALPAHLAHRQRGDVGLDRDHARSDLLRPGVVASSSASSPRPRSRLVVVPVVYFLINRRGAAGEAAPAR